MPPATPLPAEDALAEALTDLTAEAGSLVEALDDLGDPAAYSPAGHARFRALGGELRALRGQLSRPLPDLIGEVERTLGLDIEVASRPVPTRCPPAPTWTPSPTRRTRSPGRGRSRRWGRSSLT